MAANFPLKKVSDDPRYRVFSSTLFDPHNYVRTIIRDGKSEEAFENIVNGISDINLEIKGYISQHKVMLPFAFFKGVSVMIFLTRLKG
jgi:hypothetical protein